MPRNLLLADDSITIQKVIGITFAGEDFNVVAVDNGADALVKAREIHPDIVLADVVMPQKNGYEVCEAIKTDAELGHIPVLLLAGTFESFDDARARAARADGHIAKPFETVALLNKVRELLARSAVAGEAPVEFGAARSGVAISVAGASLGASAGDRSVDAPAIGATPVLSRATPRRTAPESVPSDHDASDGSNRAELDLAEEPWAEPASAPEKHAQVISNPVHASPLIPAKEPESPADFDWSELGLDSDATPSPPTPAVAAPVPGKWSPPTPSVTPPQALEAPLPVPGKAAAAFPPAAKPAETEQESVPAEVVPLPLSVVAGSAPVADRPLPGTDTTASGTDATASSEDLALEFEATRAGPELVPFGEPIDLLDLQIPEPDDVSGAARAEVAPSPPELAAATEPRPADVSSASVASGSAAAAPQTAEHVEGDGGEARLREAISRASREVIERIAWEVIPTLADAIIREHVERLAKERKS